MKVREYGYLNNLAIINNKYYAFIGRATSSENNIVCQFDAKWGNTLKSINIPSKIYFEGIIDYSNVSIYISLRDCLIE